MMIRLRHLVFILALSAVLTVVGCAKKAFVAAPMLPSPLSPAAFVFSLPLSLFPPVPTLASRALIDEEVFARKSVVELNAEKPFDDVFFDLDQVSLKDSAKLALQKDADWLKKYGSVAIIVEGYCDLRGSAEYNLGLGSRRVTVVKEYLVSLGVSTSCVQVVSKGKEQLFCNE